MNRSRLVAAVTIAGVITALAWAGLSADVFFGTQLRLADSLFPSSGSDPAIVVVKIDQETLDAVKQRWPWDRSIHAKVIRQLDRDGAAFIGYDVTFAGSSTRRADAKLAQAVAEAGNVVLADDAEFPRTTPGDVLQARSIAQLPMELSAAAAAVAHPNVFPDTDGVVRALPPVIRTPSGGLMPSLSFALYRLQAGAEAPIAVRPDGFEAGNMFVPTGPAHLMDVNYVRGFRTVSARDVLNGTVDPDLIRGHIVLVGATATGLGDVLPTPLDKSDKQAGVYIHANALDTMLRGTYLVQDGHGATLVSVAIFATVVALAVAFLWMWLSPIVTLGLLAMFFLIAFRRFDQQHVMNLVYPALGAVLAYVAALGVKYFTEVRERRRVTHVFGRYVAPDVVEEVLAAPENAVATLKGASRQLTMLFADLRGFTGASENASPEDVVEALNVYLDAMTRAVLEERGTIDKFMGDCVMAFWGAPKSEPRHAEKAIRAAMRMQDYIDEAMSNGSAAQRLKVKGCGVGIASGDAVVGNIGSVDRLDYTVIGDTVNTASRLCGVAGAGEIVCTEDTAYRLGLLGTDVRLGELPPLVVKGKVEPLKVYQVLRPGQEAIAVKEGDVTVMVEEKGHFEPAAAPAPADADADLEPVGAQPSPPKVAGYAPVEPLPEVDS